MVVLGRINAVFGIKGWVKVQSFTEHDEDLFQYRPLWCCRRGQWEPVELAEWRRHGKGFVAAIRGCSDRDQAETYARCELGAKVGQLPQLEEGEYYWHQLEGLQVCAGKGGAVLLGVVGSLLETGANDVLVVEPSAGSVDDRQRLIPYRPGEVVLEVDLANGRILVDWDPEF